MSPQAGAAPSRLLEITIISAHDLPPVAKMLRTFAVAYVHPNHKFTTRIDHRGHTNPTWNHKLTFHVDDKFLNNEPNGAITFEIYNLAWLRDLPVGIARLHLGNLSPPLLKNPAPRRVALQISRPSGHLRGTLNVNLQLVDEDRGRAGLQEHGRNKGSRTATPPKMESSTHTCPSPKCSPNYSGMESLPWEISADLRKGLYSSEWTNYRSSIFDGWTMDEKPGKKKKRKKKTGLLSWLFCGSEGMKEKRNGHKQNVQIMSIPEENLRVFYA